MKRPDEKVRRDRYRAQGRCVYCGRRPVEGRVSCQRCADVRNAAWRRFYDRRKER